MANKYEMRVDLSVLESLGINLYSNAAAVLSELVANAYDADATKVSIQWKPAGSEQVVVVKDNGTGMSVKELNDRFLKVGYKKRDIEGTLSPKFNRPFMGRKGIGKLSVFSIARTVRVFSTKNGQSNGLEINVDELEKKIKTGSKYYPTDIPTPKEYASKGTVLVLSDLKNKRADLTASALRKRLARRFDVMDNRTARQGGFAIEVNGKRLTWMDRQELKKLQFIWEFGSKSLPDDALPNGISRYTLPAVIDAGKGWRISGWFGTARKPTDLTDDDESGSLRNIIVLARKRPIQEGIIEKLDFSRVFGTYVTGQVEADFLDLDDDGYEDIATSDRQRLIEDDERVIALQEFLRKAFVQAADTWSKERSKKEAVDVLARWPKLKEWLDTRPGNQKAAATHMIGTIASLNLEKKTEAADRAALFRSGILAFERVGLRQAADELESLSSVRAVDLLPLLGKQDDYEAGLWADILRSRVEAISSFRSITKADEKEQVLQKHLFRHLWLMDPSWERATLSERMEENLRDIAPGVFAKDDEEVEIKGRVDIRYVTNSGRHVIVELKRYSQNPDVLTLATQGLKYYNAMASVLSQQQREDEPIEVVFVLGHKPRTKGKGASGEDEYIRNQFANIKGRYVLYDALIENASRQYEQYLAASDQARMLEELLTTIDIEAVNESDAS